MKLPRLYPVMTGFGRPEYRKKTARLRPCEVCGAQVTNTNPKCTTCGPICTKAKKNGRTLKEQMDADLKGMWRKK